MVQKQWESVLVHFIIKEILCQNHKKDKPTIKIAIAKDLNNDNKADWQDAAIAYRDIMQDIKGYQDVNNNVGMRIAMNFGSQAQQPFLKNIR